MHCRLFRIWMMMAIQTVVLQKRMIMKPMNILEMQKNQLELLGQLYLVQRHHLIMYYYKFLQPK